MTTTPPVPHLTDRDRRLALYGEPAERPEYVSPFERNMQELLDRGDRLARGQEAMRP
jgi:hypothetical protein